MKYIIGPITFQHQTVWPGLHLSRTKPNYKNVMKLFNEHQFESVRRTYHILKESSFHSNLNVSITILKNEKLMNGYTILLPFETVFEHVFAYKFPDPESSLSSTELSELSDSEYSNGSHLYDKSKRSK